MVHLAACLGMLLALTVSGASTAQPTPAPPADDRLLASGDAAVYGVTLLRSHDPNPADLVAFIERNWFEMDAIAVSQGLMTSYDLLAAPRGEDAAWNVAVIVGYPTPGGYADIQDAFEAIRAAHETVPVNGRDQLSDFGRVVGSQTLGASVGE